MTRFSADDVLAGLKDFQRASVHHAFRRLYLDADSTRRFLIADETGLGKTMVAKGVIARTIERLQDDESIRRIDIVYVCSNADIAEQNLRKLTVTGDHRSTAASRLTMLVAQPQLLESSATGSKPVTFVSFTPATSFEMGWQTGKAQERAILFLLLDEHLGLRGAASTALKRVFQGGVASLRNFQGYIDAVEPSTDGPRWERSIQRAFLRAFDRSRLRAEVFAMVEELRGKGSLWREQRDRADELIVGLRRLLARAGVHALEPDLVILDEFQRFKGLLTPGNEAAELAHHLFDQPEARVLLLSATPYKPFTLAEEAAAGEDHYQDLFATLDFLARGDGSVEAIRQGLSSFRTAALAGRSDGEGRLLLESALLRLLSRVERPHQPDDRTHTQASDVRAEDLAGFVALHRLAHEVDAPVTVEYWKSAPYFANFLDGYKVGERLKEAMKDPVRRQALRPLLKSAQRIERSLVERSEPLEWGNARLRQLASETVERGWWKLLWVPPSLPYHDPAGPYASPDVAGLTKRLVFSSWVAAPSAIASLLSYETERRIRVGSGATPGAAFTPRLQYRLTDGRPTSMTTLALFWPSPTLAAVTDPLDAARRFEPAGIDVGMLNGWVTAIAERLVGTSDTVPTSASTAWYWASVVGLDAASELADSLVDAPAQSVVDALLGTAADEVGEGADVPRALSLHVEEALGALRGRTPDIPRPSDLAEVVGLIGLAGPGNIAWRALQRLIPADATVSDVGLWQAAAVLASGFRALFNRPDATGLLDSLGVSDDETYWRAVLAYCRDGNLQAVLDEYLHHLSGAEGIDADSDDGLRRLAEAARRALAIRGATYRATDTDHPEGPGIPFFGRFALRYGGVRQEQDDVRLPEVRAAFNSPFWPIVLATTSIGQEGIDLHWWCHSIVHWNLPANPVDFEQREGRVNRFKGHAIRRNVALGHRAAALADPRPDVWQALFEAAELDRDADVGDMAPYWMYPGPAVIERSVLGFPMSRDRPAWERLKEILALYRLAYGQPRQEDMVELLRRRGVTADDLDALRLRLAPPQLQAPQ